MSYLGTPSKFRGAHATSTYYITNDQVTYNGSVYAALADFTSGGSFDLTKWAVVYAAGTGPAGPAGPAGNTILHGSGTPSDSVGVAGDYYNDYTNNRLYGPKPSTSQWAGPVSPTWRSDSTATSSTTSLTPAVPSGLQVGDLMIASFESWYYAPSTTSGWLTIQSTANGNDYLLTQYRIATAADLTTPYTFTVGGAGYGNVIISAYYNVNTSTPILASNVQYPADSAASTALAVPGGVSTAVVFASGVYGGNYSFTAAQSQQLRAAIRSVNSGYYGALADGASQNGTSGTCTQYSGAAAITLHTIILSQGSLASYISTVGPQGPTGSTASFPTRSVTAADTMTTSDATILANGTFNETLPSASASVGKRFSIKNTGTGTITVVPASGTIDGAANKALTVQYTSVDLVTDGTNWFEV